MNDCDKRFYANKHTTEDIKACALDLKVLGKKDFKNLLKWRLALREQVRPPMHKAAL
jgi:AdoMet-dependent rRNA methyltransferase SPB1